MRTFAIGDIHGCLNALRRLDQKLHFCPEDTVITLGDYVDRGPDSRGVINELIALRERCHLITLRGNHEIMMIEARSGGFARLNWMMNGGNTTLDNYGGDSMDEIPETHWEFIAKTLPHYELGQNFYIHANADPDLPIVNQPDHTRYWKRLSEFTPHQSGKRMICGHSAQTSGDPLIFDGAVCIDTHAVGGQWLTCLDADNNHYWQANEQGDIRENDLC